MNHSTRETKGRHATAFDLKGGPVLLSAATLTGDEVCSV